MSFLIAIKRLTACPDGYIVEKCSTLCPSQQYKAFCSKHVTVRMRHVTMFIDAILQQVSLLFSLLSFVSPVGAIN